MFYRLAIGCIAAILCLRLATDAFADATTRPAVPQAAPFRDFLEAIKAGDADKFRDCQSKEIRASSQPWQTKLEEAKESLSRRYGDYDISRFTYSFAGDDGDDTHGILTISYPDRRPIQLKIVRERDNWKLASH